MFIGHYALAFGAKRVAPRASLGVLVAAAQLSDLLWPIFVLVGWEQVRIAPGDTAVSPLAFVSYPWSHSLLAVALWGLAAAVLYDRLSRDRRGAIMVGALVLSHWVLDYITHRPDLQLYPSGAARMGLGLWYSLAGTLVVEGLIFVIGLGLYVTATRPRDRVGRYALWSLVGLLLVIYFSSGLGPPPPSARAVGWYALSGWLVPFWAAWIDRHRAPVADR
jgi:LexA-binding, inner membrane-associated putative hydrolase